MLSFQLRIAFSCLRNVIYFVIINTFIINGFGKEFDKRVSEKIFIDDHPKEVINSSTNSFHSGLTIPPNKSKIADSDKFQLNDFKRQRTGNTHSFRLKRNAPLADEDLFEFMVRIANTPVEWERIRKVLSRIKQEENENGTFSNLSKTFHELKKNESRELENKFWPQSRTSWSSPRNRITNKTAKNLTDYVNLEKWPSSDWIKTLIENVTNKDYYMEDDEEDDLEYLESNEIDIPSSSTEKVVDKKSYNKSDVFEASSKLIIPNSALPNFAYRRVTPNSKSKESSAYIAVSVVSAPVNDPQDTTQIEDATNEQERTLYEKEDKYRNLERLETRRRHSRRKYHKT